MGEDRKLDHIQLTFESQAQASENHSMMYEPMLSGLDISQSDIGLDFVSKKLKAPLWVSSMTGGTEKAKKINVNLAKAVGARGLGMGLGSCRCLLDSNDRLEDFQVKRFIGDYPLYANLGIAQVETLVQNGCVNKIYEMIKKVEADGLIVHVNPLQEYMQPEGDRYVQAPIETIKRFLDGFRGSLIVKEVGQGMGPKSLLELCKLPLAAIEFAAYGGTNFTKIEQARHEAFSSGTRGELLAFANVGHAASEMVEWVNEIMRLKQAQPGGEILCDSFIVSGGIKSMAQGHSLRRKLKANSVIGMASAYLEKALEGEDEALAFVDEQIEALKLANLFLR